MLQEKNELQYNDIVNKIYEHYHTDSDGTLISAYFLGICYALFCYYMVYDIIICDMFATILNYEPGFLSALIGFVIFCLYNYISADIFLKKDPKFLKLSNFYQKFAYFPIVTYVFGFYFFAINLYQSIFNDSNKKRKLEHQALIDSIESKDYINLMSMDIDDDKKTSIKEELKERFVKETDFNSDQAFIKHLKQHNSMRTKNRFN